MTKVNNTQVVVIGQEPAEFGFVPLMIVCGVVALIVTNFWQILTVSAVLLAIFMLWRAVSIERRRENALRARADQQDAAFLATGDLGVRDERFGQR